MLRISRGDSKSGKQQAGCQRKSTPNTRRPRNLKHTACIIRVTISTVSTYWLIYALLCPSCAVAAAGPATWLLALWLTDENYGPLPRFHMRCTNVLQYPERYAPPQLQLKPPTNANEKESTDRG